MQISSSISVGVCLNSRKMKSDSQSTAQPQGVSFFLSNLKELGVWLKRLNWKERCRRRQSGMNPSAVDPLLRGQTNTGQQVGN